MRAATATRYLWRLVLGGMLVGMAGLPVKAQQAPPGLDANGRALWDAFLLENLPRTAAVSPDGHLGWHSGSPPAEGRARALANCRTAGGIGCVPYAEGLDVVLPGHAQVAPAPPGPLAATWNWSLVPDGCFWWHGPQAAAGVVVWMEGKGGGIGPGLQPPPLLRPFSVAGFDVMRLDREPAADDRDRAAGWLRDALALLRAQGWRRVVVAGQSRGAWNALQVLDTPGLADAVIALSPAAQGTAGGASAPGESGGGLNLPSQNDELRRVMAAIPPGPARLAVAQFAGDPFISNADTRIQLLERVRPRLGALLLIDRPGGFTGHGAGTTRGFAQAEGACLLRFVLGTAEAC